MLENKIRHSNIESVKKMVQEFHSNENLHFVEIQGREIQSWEDYIKKIEDTFKLPTKWPNSIDGYNDWMRDLEWLGKDEYALIIYNYENFLEQDLSLKKVIMDDFAESIMPWWQDEVETCVVGGKAKPFNVYIVD